MNKQITKIFPQIIASNLSKQPITTLVRYNKNKKKIEKDDVFKRLKIRTQMNNNQFNNEVRKNTKQAVEDAIYYLLGNVKYHNNNNKRELQLFYLQNTNKFSPVIKYGENAENLQDKITSAVLTIVSNFAIPNER